MGRKASFVPLVNFSTPFLASSKLKTDLLSSVVELSAFLQPINKVRQEIDCSEGYITTLYISLIDFLLYLVFGLPRIYCLLV